VNKNYHICVFFWPYFDYGVIPEQKGQFFGGATASVKNLKIGTVHGFWDSPKVQGLSRLLGQSHEVPRLSWDFGSLGKTQRSRDCQKNFHIKKRFR